jgi:hypothetical protein
MCYTILFACLWLCRVVCLCLSLYLSRTSCRQNGSMQQCPIRRMNLNQSLWQQFLLCFMKSWRIQEWWKERKQKNGWLSPELTVTYLSPRLWTELSLHDASMIRGEPCFMFCQLTSDCLQKRGWMMIIIILAKAIRTRNTSALSSQEVNLSWSKGRLFAAELHFFPSQILCSFANKGKSDGARSSEYGWCGAELSWKTLRKSVACFPSAI